ncbi:conserved Plasmodium protein, unknown function [Plasmodium chabaudi chabaudi]|uniref:Uncharacterized protein n=2 Tax=Plasmodium chabaudi TaxID=5825 RepID=A0A077TRI9_PLACU|nr:conserved protein, unknown function [Plasmodium chabaudi chabaudi]SCM25467.1 conserved Plasmodium protein, unknown function [Plasmodium chabaudi adami]SCN63375.1 conserved Plasmodium protein, unknown function [Plasmodium chabaudi adami]SCN63414.1 conserved Plasmodium protein, unknown function [Plasmodium chabaudi chabaudi]VTZ71161.1 conserved protein, unknown function [Plasmodium chabaudi chabaudi]|eukprot:XP_016655017.1 conserved Plasmodium protein, unknown function [Plasmodium chabaudi chabaudi]
MLLNLDINQNFRCLQFIKNSLIPMLFDSIHLLRPRKQMQRVDRCRTKKQYKNRRHFRGYYYRWMGSY